MLLAGHQGSWQSTAPQSVPHFLQWVFGLGFVFTLAEYGAPRDVGSVIAEVKEGWKGSVKEGDLLPLLPMLWPCAADTPEISAAASLHPGLCFQRGDTEDSQFGSLEESVLISVT